MASRRQQLQQLAVAMVAEGWKPTFYELVGRLQQEAGANQAEANQAVLDLLGRGVLRTTGASRIELPQSSNNRGGAGNTLGIVAAVLGIVAAGLGIWEIGARNGFLPGPGPVNIVFPTPDSVDTSSGPSIPSIPTGEQLGAPALSASGDCTTGYTLHWTAVDGAERYRVEVDGHFRGREENTDLFVSATEVFQDQRYAVFAEALVRPRSEASNVVTVAGC